jgi:hypothetical protein
MSQSTFAFLSLPLLLTCDLPPPCPVHFCSAHQDSVFFLLANHGPDTNVFIRAHSIRYRIRSAYPVNYVEEGKKLINLIRSYG